MISNIKKGLTTLLLVAVSAFAQHPISDKVVVTFSKPVMVGDTRIEAGEYTIRQLTSAANPRILEFSTDKGTKLQASAMAIPVLDNLNTRQTIVQVFEGPNEYQLHRIWIEGKSYGYEFPGPTGRFEQEQAQSQRMVIRGTYTPERREVAQAEAPRAAAEPAPAPAEPPPPPSPPQREPEPAPPAPQREPEPAPPAPQREPEPAPVPQSDPPAPTPAPAEARQAATPPMPATATNWYTIAAGGLLLTALGLILERAKS